jgi:DNA-binding NarL/FixJ family response regulator
VIVDRNKSTPFRSFTMTPQTNFATQPAYPMAPVATAHDGSRVEGVTGTTRRLLVVDDHALLRFGLQSLLTTPEHAIEFVEAECLSDAIDAYRRCSGADLVLLDLNMNDCRGLQGLQQFLNHFPDARVAVLSATQDEFVVKQAQAMGAVAYLSKMHAPQALAQMIVSLLQFDNAGTAADGGSRGFAKPSRNPGYDRVAELGPRHLEILDLILFGCSNQEIANATKLSLGTVKNYVSTILLALDVKSRSHLISVFR